MNEIDALQARNLISEKEWITANANRDLSLGGCRRDYQEWMAATDAELQAILERNKLMNTWKPIDTAPRDGTPILGWSKERGQRETRMGRYTKGSPGYDKWEHGDGPLNSGWEWDTHHNFMTTWNPTHWMPRLEPPNTGEG